jgi:hypothetical protein
MADVQKCPSCGSSRVYPSRTRTLIERLRRVFSEKQPYRCHACNHRSWELISLPMTEGPDAEPEDLRTGLSSRPITVADLDRLDRHDERSDQTEVR